MSTETTVVKKAVYDKIESQIHSVQAKLETLKARAEATKANTELKMIGDLATKKVAIDHKLAELKKASESAFQHAKADIESRVAELESSLKAIESKLKAA
jgi:DNA-binding protein YbaB